MTTDNQHAGQHTAHIDTSSHVKNDGEARLPHERDSSPDGQNAGQQDVMKQAAKDLEQGLVDTDMHGERGQEKVTQNPAKEAVPVNPDAKSSRPT